MKRSELLGAACLIIIAATPAQAADWQYVTTGRDDSHWYVDQESIRTSGKLRYFWVKVDASASKEVEYYEEKRNLIADCVEHKMQTIAFISYDANGALLNSESMPHYRQGVGMTPVAPDTVGNTLLKRVCT